MLNARRQLGIRIAVDKTFRQLLGGQLGCPRLDFGLGVRLQEDVDDIRLEAVLVNSSRVCRRQ